MKRYSHPWHPLCVHLPLGCLTLVLPLDVAGWLGGNEFCWACSRLLLAAGLLGAGLAALTGLIDYARVAEGSAAMVTAQRHLTVMLVAMSLFAASGCLRIDRATPSAAWQAAAVALSAAGFAAIVLGGWLGSRLVYHHGLGARQDN
jgi:uncharacterized membrane protein